MTREAQEDSTGSLVIFGLSTPGLVEKWVDAADTLPDRVLVMDPRIKSATTPAKRLGVSGKTIEVVTAMASTDDGETRLFAYSQPGLHAPASPTPALKERVPTLKIRRRVSVATLGPDSIAARLAALPDPLSIWIDAPGTEATILSALENAGMLGRVRALKLRCGVEPFFDGAEGADTLAARLQARGFTVDATDDTDPDWPELSLSADPAQHRVAALETDLAKAEQKVRELREALAASENALSARLADLQERDATIAMMKTTLKSVEDKLAANEEQLARQAKAVADAEAARDAALKQAKLAEDAAQSVPAAPDEKIAQLQEKLEAEREKVETTRGSLELALRMQAMAQSDLRELQQRYEANERLRQQQTELLQKLTPRLHQAASHLQALAVRKRNHSAPSNPKTSGMIP